MVDRAKSEKASSTPAPKPLAEISDGDELDDTQLDQISGGTVITKTQSDTNGGITSNIKQ